MEIKHFAQNFTLSEPDQIFLEDKVQKLSRFSDEIQEAKVDLSYNPSHNKDQFFRIEINLVMPNKILRAVCRSINFGKAVNTAEKMLQRQLRRYKAFGSLRRRFAQKFSRKKK